MDDKEILKTFVEPYVENLEKGENFKVNWVKEAFLQIRRHLFVRRRLAGAIGSFEPLDRHNPTSDWCVVVILMPLWFLDMAYNELVR